MKFGTNFQCLHPETRGQRIDMWKHNKAAYGRKDNREQQLGNPTAVLTELGKKLLGLEEWPSDE